MADSAKRRAELEAELAALEDMDDDDEIEIEFEGRRVRGLFRRVAPIAETMGFKLRPDPAPAADDKTDDGKGKSGDVRRFGGRRIS